MADAHAKPPRLPPGRSEPVAGRRRVSAFVLAVGAIIWMHHMFAGRAVRLRRRRARRRLHHDRLVARRRARGDARRLSHPRGADLAPLRHDPVHRLGGDVLRRLVLGLFQRRAVPGRPASGRRAPSFIGGVWPPKGIETFDPWHLPLLNTLILLTSGTTVTWAHHALLRERPRGPEVGPDPHHRARRSVHLRAGLRIQPRRVQLQRQHLRRDLLHGDRLPRRPRADRHDLPDRLPDPRLCSATSRPTQHLGFEFAAWYWHFVDVVWLFLFACIYVWGAGPMAGMAAH